MAEEIIAIPGGTGDQGQGLALRWARAGLSVVIGSREAERAALAAADMREKLGAGLKVEGMANVDAVAGATIVVLTVPFSAQIATLKTMAPALRPGTLLVDVTVPLEPAVGGRPTRMLGVWAGSAAEQCAELAPAGIDVVSAFHNVGADALADLDHDVDCDIFVCGDKKDAKQRLRPLVDCIPGCRYVDAGALANSRVVESMTALLIGLNIRYKTHTGIRVTGLREL
ncbi:MAG: NADPH-dependent F420 reductase [Blastocatellia bacterium]